MKLIKSISAILLALLLVYSINYKSIVTIHFFANQAELADLFCINKEKPELKCNGKCHLSNQLVEADKEMTNSPFTSGYTIYNLELNLTLFENKIALETPFSDLFQSTYPDYTCTPCVGYHTILSPPPKA